MRLSHLAVATLASLPAGSLAFAPNANGPASTSRMSTQMFMAQENNDIVSQARNGVLSAFAASMIFLSPGPIMEPANAAVPTPPAKPEVVAVAETKPAAKAAPAKAAPAPAKAAAPAPVADPLAAEKKAVDATKSAVVAAEKGLTNAKKAHADANTLYSKANDNAALSEKKAVTSKKALIAANDKLADAKAKESTGSLSALKEVENLASKVGTFNS